MTIKNPKISDKVIDRDGNIGIIDGLEGDEFVHNGCLGVNFSTGSFTIEKRLLMRYKS